MKPYASILLFMVVSAGCGGGSERTTSARGYSSGVDHPYFPLTPGVLRIYEGDDEGLPRRDEVETLVETHDIVGVACTAVVQKVFLDGVPAEVTTEWYARDGVGNVWKFGEEGLAFDGSDFVLTPDSWMAGVDDAEPWIAFPAELAPGDWFAGYRPGGVDVFGVLSVTDHAVVPAGTFENCLRLVENPDDPDQDIILYAPKVGCISERSDRGKIELISIRRR